MDTKRVRPGHDHSRDEMTDEGKERLEAFNAEQSDWYGQCPHCGVYWAGKLSDARTHVCRFKLVEG